MAARLMLVVGRKNSGKTTLAVALIKALRQQGLRVMSLKHGHHPVDADRHGTDTWRHFNEGGADRTLIAGPTTRVLFERTDDDYNPAALVRRYLAEADIVIAEGYTGTHFPRIEVARAEAGPPLYLSSRPDADLWKAIVTDQRLEAHCPVFTFGDTIWLQEVTRIIMSGAQAVADE